jgi:hypothetical protein
MTGMKEGAGEDPFAEDDTTATGPTQETSQAAAGVEDNTEDSDLTEANEETSRWGKEGEQMQIPYLYRRDGVQEGRHRVPLFLKEETKRAERDTLREFEDRFDENVSLTDLREALVRAGLNNIQEVGEQLEKWGYGMTFEE